MKNRGNEKLRVLPEKKSFKQKRGENSNLAPFQVVWSFFPARKRKKGRKRQKEIFFV
jgi:hypothetical protein